MNIKFELFITILVAAACDIVLAYLFLEVKEFPIWAKGIIYSLFNITIGMVIMAYMIRIESEK